VKTCLRTEKGETESMDFYVIYVRNSSPTNLGKHHRYIAPRLESRLDVYFAMEEATTPKRYWLLKAEPDSRVVKGKDVKVSELGRRVPLADLVNS